MVLASFLQREAEPYLILLSDCKKFIMLSVKRDAVLIVKFTDASQFILLHF